MKIILGSSSPRRQELLRSAGFEFLLMRPDTDETVLKGESPTRMVLRLSEEKARAIESRIEGVEREFVIIAADTTVVSPSGREVLNKPLDARDAVKILKKIQGRKHTVLTGYCLMGKRKGRPIRICKVVRTTVEMRKLDSRSIEAYIRTGEPMDKAGAYAAQGIGMSFIAGIKGSYTNVVGLPMTELLADLEKHFKLVPRWKTS